MILLAVFQVLLHPTAAGRYLCGKPIAGSAAAGGGGLIGFLSHAVIEAG